MTMKKKNKYKYKLFLDYLKNKSEGNTFQITDDSDHNEKEVKELIQLHDNINQIPVPEPSEAMKEGFHKKLKSIEAYSFSTESIVNNKTSIIQLFQKSDFLKIAASIILFALGYLAGILTNKQSKETSTLLTELQQTREILVLTLLEQPSATDRLKAVNISYQIENQDQKIIDALLTILNNDPNINVKLSAIDALIAIADNPQVRIGLIQSINKQESPIIQFALADAMIILQEKRAIEEFNKLLKNKNLNEQVELKIKQTINNLTL